jgi:hypothetical protein
VAANIYDISRQYRARMLQGLNRATREIIGHYIRIAEDLEVQARRITGRIEDAIKAGKIPAPGPETPTTFSPAWLQEKARLEALAAQARSQVQGLQAQLGGTISGLADDLVRLGIEQAETTLAQAGTTFRGLNPRAVEAMVGNLQAGSPLTNLFLNSGLDAEKMARQALIDGVASGANPRKTARFIRQAMNSTAYRSVLIARTETMRGWWEGTRRTYRANPEIVLGWVWVCALSGRTCAACFGMHGTVHPLEEDLEDHPNGRCTAVPEIRGFPLAIPDADVAFANLTPDEQLRVFGSRTSLAAYKEGRISLLDMSRTRTSAEWGTSVRRATLNDLGLKRVPGRAPAPPVQAPKPVEIIQRPATVVREAKTTKEALAIAKELFPGKVIDYQGFHVDTANAMNRSLAALQDRFPEIAKNIGFFGRSVGAKTFLGRVRTPRNAYAWATHGSIFGGPAEGRGVLALVGSWAKDPAKFLRQLASDMRAGWHPAASATIEAVIRHEFGHHIFYMIERDPVLLRRMTEKLMATGVWREGAAVSWGASQGARVTYYSNEVRQGLSAYATKNWHEFFSEAFSEYTTSSSPRVIARAIGEFLEEAFPRVAAA